MPRGSKTSNRVREKALALVAVEGNYETVGRMLKMSARTVKELADKDQGFAEVRAEIEQGYIIEAWGNISIGSRLLNEKLRDADYTDKLSIRALSEVLVNLHNTVSNVATHMMAIQVNVGVQCDNPEDIDRAAYLYIANKHRLSIEEVKERLG